MVTPEGIEVRKWITLGVITIVLLLVGSLFKNSLDLHESYFLMVAFFTIQTIVLFRIDQWIPEEWKSWSSLIKIVLRLLTSWVFITVLIYVKEDLYRLIIQFIILYLIYMIFEIVSALTNLRRN